MDDTDIRALKHLMKSGRSSWAELSGVLGLSSQSIAERVRRLEETGVIRGYAALVDPGALGCETTSFIEVTLEHPKFRSNFLERIVDLQEVQECHHIAGAYDYLLKVRCASNRDLERFVSDDLKGCEGIARTVTTVVLSTAKETSEVPVKGFKANSNQNQRN